MSIVQIIGLMASFVGGFVFFALKEFFIFLKPKEEIIYQAKDFRKKRKAKSFKVKIGLSKKFKFGTKLKILFTLLILISISAFSCWYFIFRGLPSPEELKSRKINVSTKIYDRNGVLLYQIYKDENRTPVKLKDIPQSVIQATLATEDAYFYQNPGFSFRGIVRAIIADISNKNLEHGGSTITQQLVKNTLLSNEKTFIRKMKEIVLAIQVERHFSKDEILEMYLNEVSYGGTAYGIEAGSQTYFGKDINNVNLAEASLLAGLPKSPTVYSPYGTNPEKAKERQREVLRLMLQNGFITETEKLEAENTKLEYKTNDNIKAPHFVMYVREKLVQTYGEDLVNGGGLNVVTTLDLNIQEMAQKAVRENVDKLKNLHVTNGAAIVIDPTNGEILAMVGSKDYFNNEMDGNVNVLTSLRPPGSSIKVVNYAYALSHGYTPVSEILDKPITYRFLSLPDYKPVNYDGQYVGNITLRNALAQSRNIPAVKLLNTYGVKNMIEMGKSMGISTWNEENTYGLSLTLGGGSTKLIDMARVFGTIANLGKRPSLFSVKKVTDYNGKNLEISCDHDDCEIKEALDPKVSYQLIDILKDNNARAAEFGSRSALYIDKHPEVAVKTGTSNDLRDNVTIGFSQKYLTAVWVGNNDNSPMSRIASGITGAAPIWNEIMVNLLRNSQSQEWPIPQGLVNMISGCPPKSEWFIDGTQRQVNCPSELVEDKDHED